MTVSELYDFESDDEGWTANSSEVDLQHEFEEWLEPTKGISDSYIFELMHVAGYEISQSINAYSTMKISMNRDRRIYNVLGHNERRLLQDVELIDDVYDTKRAKGEIRK